MKKALLTVLTAVFVLASTEAGACTTAVIGAGASESGRPMLWKQRDTGNPFNVLVHIPAADGRYAYTAVFNADDLARNAVYAGSNEKGFAIINNMSYNLAKGSYDALNGSLMRRALESCATVAEFEAMLRSEDPRTCEANFGVLDATGAACYIEASDSVLVRYDVPEDGWLVRTNYSLAGSPEGSGYARYETAVGLMERHKGKFTPEDLVDGLGRSYRNAVLGYDASRIFACGFTYDEDFIPRPSTTSSVVIDGGDLMWVAIGYTPGAYMMPVRVSAGAALPACLTPGENGNAPANMLADEIKKKTHHLGRDAGKKYVDFRVMRPVLRIVRRYEKAAADIYARCGTDVEEMNRQLDALFARFRDEIDTI